MDSSDDIREVGRSTLAPHPIATVVLVLEALGALCLTVVYVLGLISGDASTLGGAAALTIIVALAAVWITVLAVGALRRRAWVRAGAIVWQFLQAAVALGAFEGVTATPAYGWILLVPALIALVFLIWTPGARRRDSGAGTDR